MRPPRDNFQRGMFARFVLDTFCNRSGCERFTNLGLLFHARSLIATATSPAVVISVAPALTKMSLARFVVLLSSE